MNTKLKLALVGSLAVHTWVHASVGSAAALTTCQPGGWGFCISHQCSPTLWSNWWTSTCVNREGFLNNYECSCTHG
jgi:hypothetical protein